MLDGTKCMMSISLLRFVYAEKNLQVVTTDVHCCFFCLSHCQQTYSVTVGKPRQVIHHILDDSFDVVL